MTSREYNLWTLTELRLDDPRPHMDLLILSASLGKIQAIQHKANKVFIISEEQYNKLKTVIHAHPLPS